MKAASVALVLLLTIGALSGRPARAGFTSAQLDALAAAPPPEAALPSALSFRDESGRSTTLAEAIGGRSAIVIFADYTCRTLCGPIVEFVTGALDKTGLKPQLDYRLVVIGLNPRDGIDAARAMRATHLGADNPAGRAAVFLTGRDEDIHRAAEAVGLHYAYDPEHDQYAHPAAVYVVDRRGRVARVLSALGIDGTDLRLALVDAGHGAVGTLADRIHLLCYGFDPVRGIYTERITTLLEISAGATLLVMACCIGTLLARERRRASP